MMFSGNEMNTYFLCDPLSMLPPAGPSALKILVEIPNYSEVMKSNLTLTVLEAVRFKFSFDTYEECIKAMQNLPHPQFSIEQRSDVKEDLPKEDSEAINRWRVWFINDLENHYKYFNHP